MYAVPFGKLPALCLDLESGIVVSTGVVQLSPLSLLIEAKVSDDSAPKRSGNHIDGSNLNTTDRGMLKDLYEASQEMRVLAYEHECEMESHKVRLLGLPLDMRLMESLFGGVIAIVLMFYQTM